MSPSDNKTNDPDSSTKQIALPGQLSSQLNSDEGDLLDLAVAASQGPPIEPPRPAIRQRVTQARSVHVTGSSSASASSTSRTFSEQTLVTQQQQVLISDTAKNRDQFRSSSELQPTTRPLSIDPSNFDSANISAHHQQEAFSSFARASFQQTASSSSSAQQRFSTSSLQVAASAQSASISTATTGPTTFVARQLSASQQQQQVVATSSQSRTTTQRVIASRTISSSQTKLSSGSSAVSGQAISSAGEAEALFEKLGSSAASTTVQIAGSQTSTITASQRASRTISSGASEISSVTSGGSAGQQSIQFEQSLKSSSSAVATAVTRTSRIVKTTSTSTSQRVSTSAGGAISQSLIKNSSSSSGALVAASRQIDGSLVGPITAAGRGDEIALVVATRGQSAGVLGQIVESDTSRVGPSETLGKFATRHSSLDMDSGTSADPNKPSPLPTPKATWTTTAAERAIASRYLDQSFGSMNPSVGVPGLVADVSQKQSSDVDPAQDSRLTETTNIRGKREINSELESLKTTKSGASQTANQLTKTTMGSIPVVQTIQDINHPETSGAGGKDKLATTTAASVASKPESNIVPIEFPEAISTIAPLDQKTNKGEQTTPVKSGAASAADVGSSTAGADDGGAPGQGGTSATDINLQSEPTVLKVTATSNLDQFSPNSGSESEDSAVPAAGPRSSGVLDQLSIVAATSGASKAGQPQDNWGSDTSVDNKAITLPIISATTRPNVNYRAINAATGKGAGADTSTYLPLPTETTPRRPYPKKVFFIIVNEFCERFSYYGLRTVLVLYFRGVLGFTDANSTVAFHLFAALCYLTPIMGAILADTSWGKFKTILYLSILYFIGELILVSSSIFWNNGGFSVSATILGLTLIGFGTGGIKPCVSTLGGDQFYSHETHWRETFFSIFYGAINLGALASMFLTPLVRSNFQCVDRTDCYPLAFGLPCALMLIAIVVFAMAKNRYYLAPVPEKNVLIAFGGCVWLAMKRKLSGHKLPEAPINLPTTNPSHLHSSNYDNIDTSSSNLSVSSNEEGISHSAVKNNTNTKKTTDLRGPLSPPNEQLSAEEMLSYHNGGGGGGKSMIDDSLQSASDAQVDRSHWLYLASDQFDTKSIEDFRSVLGALVLMLPMPVWSSLFDQQSSLWTLQAVRMDGRIWGTNYILEPDQMSVLNPLLLLVCIAVFQIIIYPSLRRCNIMQSSIQKITVGGLFLALAFVASALIELRIQQHLPPAEPEPGQASLLFVNGLSDCSMSNPMISYESVPSNNGSLTPTNQTIPSLKPLAFSQIEPLGSKGLSILASPGNNQMGPTINHYHISFKLIDGQIVQMDHGGNVSGQPSSLFQQNPAMDGVIRCPFSQTMDHHLTVKPLNDKAVKLLYLEQGNGKLAHKIFEDSLEMPKSGKARVRLMYEFFGSATLAHTHQFYLDRAALYRTSSAAIIKPEANLKFHTTTRDGQVLVSQFMDVDVSAKGDLMLLKTDDILIGNQSTLYQIPLECGTRNLIVVHQNNASNVEVKHQVLQDNHYRVSMLWQLIPYLLLCISEVLFSITGLEFAYSMAPKTMKTILMAAFCTTTAVGNLLTVAIESMHLFTNPVADFLFYAFIMVLSMIAFAVVGYYHKPRRLRDD